MSGIIITNGGSMLKQNVIIINVIKSNEKEQHTNDLMNKYQDCNIWFIEIKDMDVIDARNILKDNIKEFKMYLDNDNIIYHKITELKKLIKG